MITFLSVNEDMTTSTIHENFNEAITDEYGVTYSKDGRKLLRSPKELDGNYSIKKIQRLFVIGHLKVALLCVVLLFLRVL